MWEKVLIHGIIIVYGSTLAIKFTQEETTKSSKIFDIITAIAIANLIETVYLR